MSSFTWGSPGRRDVRALSARVVANCIALLDDYSFSRMLESVWELISRVNKYIVENEPWALAEKPAEAGRLDSVLFHCAESLRIVAALLAPVMPKSSQTIWNQLGLDGHVADVKLNELQWSNDLAGKTVRGGTALFPRVDSKEIYKKLESAVEAATPAAVGASANGASPLAPIITIDDFAKVDLRAGTVVEAERIKGADKLLRLIVDLGFEKRPGIGRNRESLRSGKTHWTQSGGGRQSSAEKNERSGIQRHDRCGLAW
jgi:methionyl-tRNA synthetase